MYEPASHARRKPPQAHGVSGPVRGSESSFFLPLADAVLSASRDRFQVLNEQNNLYGFLYNVSDLSLVADDDLRTKCKAMESPLTANHYEGQQQVVEKDVDAVDLQRELRSLSKLMKDIDGPLQCSLSCRSTLSHRPLGLSQPALVILCAKYTCGCSCGRRGCYLQLSACSNFCTEIQQPMSVRCLAFRALDFFPNVSHAINLCIEMSSY